MIRVRAPYFGELSVNSYKVIAKGGKKTSATKPAVKDWMVDVADMVRAQAVFLYGNEYGSFVIPMDKYIPNPITVRLWGKFKDERVPDMDNLAKVTLDAIKVGLGVDDKYLKYIPVGYEIGYEVPVLEIEIDV